MSFLLLLPVFLWCHSQKIIAKTNVKELFSCAFFWVQTWRIWYLAQPLCFMSANKVILEGMLKPRHAHKNSLWKKNLCLMKTRREISTEESVCVFSVHYFGSVYRRWFNINKLRANSASCSYRLLILVRQRSIYFWKGCLINTNNTSADKTCTILSPDTLFIIH